MDVKRFFARPDGDRWKKVVVRLYLIVSTYKITKPCNGPSSTYLMISIVNALFLLVPACLLHLTDRLWVVREVVCGPPSQTMAPWTGCTEVRKYKGVCMLPLLLPLPHTHTVWHTVLTLPMCACKVVMTQECTFAGMFDNLAKILLIILPRSCSSRELYMYIWL